MSGRLVGDVLRYAGTRKPAGRLVLVAIAEHARDDGSGAFPKVQTLVDETALSRRTVIRMLDELERSGDLTIERRPGQHHRYIVHPCQRDTGATVTRDTVTPAGVVDGTGGGAMTAPPGVVDGTGPGVTVAPEPSVEPPGKHKGESPARARRARPSSLSTTTSRAASPTANELRAMGASRDSSGRWWIFDNATSESRLVHDERLSA